MKIIKHFEKEVIIFNTDLDFIRFIKIMCIEKGDTQKLNFPDSVEDCINYIDKYCDNYKVIEN